MAVINVGVYESINGWTGGWSGARTWVSQKIDDQSAFQNKASCARQDTLTSADLNSNRAAFRSAATDAVNALDQGLGRSVLRAGQLESEALLSGSLARWVSLGTLSDNLLMIDTRSGYGGFTALRVDPLSGLDSVTGQSRLNAQHAALLQGVDQASGILMFYAQKPEFAPLQEVTSRSIRALYGLTEAMTCLDRSTGVRVSWGRDTALITVVDGAAALARYAAQSLESIPALDVARAWASMMAAATASLSLSAVAIGRQSATSRRSDAMSLSDLNGGVRVVHGSDLLALTFQEIGSGQARLRANQNNALNLLELTGAKARFYAIKDEPVSVGDLIRFIDLLTDDSGRLVAALDVVPRALVGAASDRLFTNEAADRDFTIDQTVERTFQS